MAGELILGDFFTDFNTNEFDSVQSTQSWMTDIFETLDDQQITHDDFILENIPEEIKTKLDAPLCDILKTENDFFVGDEIEIRESTSLVSSFLDDTANSDESSGYASCVQSSNNCSPNLAHMNNESSRPTTLRIVPTSDTKSFTTNSPHKIHVTRINPPQNKTTVQAVLQKSSFRLDDNKPNRVHFILRPLPPDSSHKTVSLDEINLENKSSGKPSYLNEHSNLTNPKSLYKFLHVNKIEEDPVYDRSGVVESLTSCGSQSSSESDSRDIYDDDMSCHENLNEYPLDQTGFKKSLLSHQNLSTRSRNAGTSKGLPRLSDIDTPFYDDGSPSDYSQSTKITQQRFFHDQMYSRIRGTTQIGQSDINHSHMLVLTEEEKRTLIAEGYSIPTRLPLSKQDERNLKKVRRKIKNKISAQESRRKKKEYLEALERKVSIYSQENTDLKRRVDGLESTNRSLLGQLRLLQQLVSKSKASNTSNSTCSTDSNKTGNQPNHLTTSINGSVDPSTRITYSNGSPSTCLMVFALCFAALWIGQPSGNGNQSAMNSGLSFTLSPQNSFNFWVSQVPQRLVSGSLSQIGYSFSKQPQFNEYKHSSFDNFDVKKSYDAQSVVHDSPQEQTSKLVSQLPQHSSPATQKFHVQRSRLLGEASELEDCGPANSFWSYLFGNPTSSKHQICGRNDDLPITELQLFDDIERDLMLTLLPNSTDSKYYSKFNESKSSFHVTWPPVIELS
ncbi:camp-response element binding protein-related [Schistosoma mansoni]|uniref:camp-response element binding protein-related n=1 Tax=Schistosoma mansoni TaxID=6183 RepID=UPI0001A63C5B|nr:camp-response element binding protein-related [Schistosoma mansoni]|eukprot:XP_018655130.1 camp-response element binding protein-related [Schistosoma mansoni]